MKRTFLAALLILGCATTATVADKPTTGLNCLATKPPAPSEVMTWHGLIVTNHTKNLFVVPLFSMDVQRTLKLWTVALDAEGAVCDLNTILLGTKVSLMPGKIAFTYNVVDLKTGQTERKTKKVRGVITYGTRAGIGYPSTPSKIVIMFEANWRKSALGHELGHLIAWRCLGLTGNRGLEKMSKKYGIPY